MYLSGRTFPSTGLATAACYIPHTIMETTVILSVVIRHCLSRELELCQWNKQISLIVWWALPGSKDHVHGITEGWTDNFVFTSVQFFTLCLEATKSGGREVLPTVLGQIQLRPNSKDIPHYPIQDFICWVCQSRNYLVPAAVIYFHAYIPPLGLSWKHIHWSNSSHYT